MIIKYSIAFLALSLFISCKPGGSRMYNVNFQVTPSGGKVTAHLPYRHAGWSLWVKHPKEIEWDSPVSLIVVNKSENPVYVKSTLIKSILNRGQQVEVFKGSIRLMNEEGNLFVASESGDVEVDLLIQSDQEIPLIEDFELVAYTSDGP